MKRWLSAAAAAAALAAPAVAQTSNLTRPGYLVLRVKLSSDGAAPAAPGGAPGEGDGTGAGPGPGGSGGGGQGYGGQQQQQPGGSGGPPSSGGGFGSSGGGGGPRGGMQPPGGPAGPGGPFGGLGGLGQPGGASATAAALNERSVHVLIPYTRVYTSELLYKTKQASARNPTYPAINHPFGHSLLYLNKVNVQFEFLPFTTEEQRLKEALGRWSADINHKPSVLFAYIGDALKAELLPLAEQMSDMLVRYVEKEKDVPADIAAFAKGYTELKAKWSEPATNNPAADVWKAKFGAEANVHNDAAHYSVIHFTGDALSGQAAETVSNAADLLEKNLKSFYLWHLREGFKLPLPDKRLVAVVTKNGAQLGKLREGLDGLPIGSDSFYSPVHNMVVLSPERTDELGRTFNAFAATKLEGFDRADLIQGKHPNLKPQQQPEEIAQASTYALIRRALEDEALRSAISREGSRQLFVTMNVLPQHVRMPKWVESGMGSLLQHPKGGGVVEISKDTPGIVVGTTFGHGAANYELLQQFQTFYPAKKNGQDNKDIDAPAVLTNVLTDKYFAALATGIDPDRPQSIADLFNRPGAAPAPGGPGGLPGGPAAPGGPTAPAPGANPGGPRGAPGDAQGPRGGGFPGQQQPGGPPAQPGGFTPGGPSNPMPPDSGSGIFDPTVTNPILTAVQLEQKAKATAWAVTYYMTKNGKMPKLYSFLERLNELPRDLRVDKDVTLKLFCDTFGLLKPNSSEIDKAAFNLFARDWMVFMQQQSPTFQTITLQKLNGANNNNQPGGPPGGFPGGPGGGPAGPGGVGPGGGGGGSGGGGPGGSPG